jgi:hypothetical protein
MSSVSIPAPDLLEEDEVIVEPSAAGRAQMDLLTSSMVQAPAAIPGEPSPLIAAAEAAAKVFWASVPPDASPDPASKGLQDAFARLWDVMVDLDTQIGPWTLEPAGGMSSWRVRPEVLSAHSKAWTLMRPSSRQNPHWRNEMKLMVSLLNGQVATVAPADLDDHVGPSWGTWLRHQRAERGLNESAFTAHRKPPPPKRKPAK